MCELDVYSDANWAGCRSTRKSTSGGVVCRGQHLIQAWSRTQIIIALSSSESEFLASVKASVEALGMVAMAEAFADLYQVRLNVDASAALGLFRGKVWGRSGNSTLDPFGCRNSNYEIP